MDYLYLIFLVSAFFAVVLLLEAGYTAWNSSMGPEAKRIQHRLQAMSAGSAVSAESSIVKQRLLSEMPTLERQLLRIPRVQHIDRLLVQSGLNWSVAKFAGLTLLLAVVVLIAGVVLHFYWLFIVLGMAAVATLPFLYVLKARNKRIHTIESQLPDALELMSRALRAGHSFPSSLEMVATEAPNPIAGEFKVTFDEVNYGIPMQDALMNMTTRIASSDLRYFVVAVLIQRETGGNLAELLDNLAKLMRERFKLLGQIRVLSAEGRLSAWILSLLPFVLAGVINIIHPKFLAVLWEDPVGLKFIYAALIMMLLGIMWMRKIIKIRV
ncbi:MAG: type II secretion system F family protein [Thiobacillus sp.]|jgi:tight adherence protein B|uniref:type II secretion system F family protein n=1 Tax=Thiobacillus sp. TaxID=924 RepID=UPI002893C007|nr:type II secretion system F family protein [Thiobacillus sp.]MDT3708256.1 type II secretion system F family protein [Thiobacillus sp.]